MDDRAITLVPERADTPASLAAQRAFFADIAARYPGWSPGDNPSLDPGEVAPPVGAWVVVYRGDEAIGCGGVKRLDARTAEVRRVYVAPSARGLGVGRRLLGELEDQARTLGYECLRLDTGDRQPEALGLFVAAGYRQISDYNRNSWATYWMEKRLPASTG